MTTPAACCDRCGRVGVEGKAVIDVARGGKPPLVRARSLCSHCLTALARWIDAPSRPPGKRPIRAVVDHARFQTRGGVAPAFTPGKHP